MAFTTGGGSNRRTNLLDARSRPARTTPSASVATGAIGSRLAELKRQTPKARASATGAIGSIATPSKPSSAGSTGAIGSIAGLGSSGASSGSSGNSGAGSAYVPPTISPDSPGGSNTINNWVDDLRASTQTNTKFDNSATETAVEKLRKQLYGGDTSPDLPAQVNLDNYHTELATIDDISKKFGFDYSREYAERQAEILAQAQRDQVEASRARADYETESAQTDLDHDFFAQYLEQRQALADTGLNAGIADERDLRLEMSRQYALADILANTQLYNQELDTDLQRITAEELTYAEQLFQERMQQGFGNAMEMSRFSQSENQWQGNMAMQQRAQQAEEAWREFEFNNLSESDKQRMLQDERQFGTEQAWRQYEFENMSASEKAKLAADAEKFGMEMAWERHRFEAGMEFDAGAMGFNDGSGGGAIAQNAAQQMGLTMTSHTRTPERNSQVGGSKTSSHLTGRAMDFAGTKSQMDAYAQWARNSGQFKNVLWQVPGHYDHVHVDW